MRPPGEPWQDPRDYGYELPGMASENPLPSIWKIRAAQALLDAVNAPPLEWCDDCGCAGDDHDLEIEH